MIGGAGGVGGVAPLQYRLRRLPAPQTSAAFPGHGKLQSESDAVVPPLEIVFPQSFGTQKRAIRMRGLAKLNLIAHLQHSWPCSTPAYI
jgi:hypothetical protein